MGIYILYFLLLLIPFLWIVSIFMLRKWKYILIYSILNGLLIAIYFYIIFYSNYKIFLHDEYRLKKKDDDVNDLKKKIDEMSSEFAAMLRV